MNRSIRQVILLLLAWGSAMTVNGQFTYVGASIGQHETTFARETGHLNQWRVGATGTSRPFQHFGFSLGFTIPVQSELDYNYEPLDPQWTGPDWLIHDPRYNPSTKTYTAKQGPELMIDARIFLETTLNLYFGITGSYSTYTGHFIFQRDEQARLYGPYGWQEIIPAVAIDEQRDHQVFAPGLKVGMMPSFGGRYFAELSLTWWRGRFDGEGYSYTIESDWDRVMHDHHTVIYGDPLIGGATHPFVVKDQSARDHRAFHVDLRFGIYF